MQAKFLLLTYLQNTDTEGQQLEIVKSLQVDIDFGQMMGKVDI